MFSWKLPPLLAPTQTLAFQYCQVTIRNVSRQKATSSTIYDNFIPLPILASEDVRPCTVPIFSLARALDYMCLDQWSVLFPLKSQKFAVRCYKKISLFLLKQHLLRRVNWLSEFYFDWIFIMVFFVNPVKGFDWQYSNVFVFFQVIFHLLIRKKITFSDGNPKIKISLTPSIAHGGTQMV